MFTISDHNSKLLLKLSKGTREVYEPLTRKIGGVWSPSLNGWLFDGSKKNKLDEFVTEQNSIDAENQNKEYYHKFTDDPKNYNTPTSSSEGDNEGSGLQEAFDLIHELFDRVTDLEKIIEELSKKVKPIGKQNIPRVG